MPEQCSVCGFCWDEVTAAEMPDRIVAAADRVADLFRNADPVVARQRPEPQVWSAVEYGCHVRDVLYNLRDRIVVGVVEDHPHPKPMHGTSRADLGLYAADEPVVLAEELGLAGRLVARTVAALSPQHLARTLVYPWPEVADRTLLWVAAQMAHEAEHHAEDIAGIVG